MKYGHELATVKQKSPSGHEYWESCEIEIPASRKQQFVRRWVVPIRAEFPVGREHNLFYFHETEAELLEKAPENIGWFQKRNHDRCVVFNEFGDFEFAGPMWFVEHWMDKGGYRVVERKPNSEPVKQYRFVDVDALTPEFVRRATETASTVGKDLDEQPEYFKGDVLETVWVRDKKGEYCPLTTWE